MLRKSGSGRLCRIYNWDFGIVWRYSSVFLAGLLGTLKLTSAALIGGLVIGLGVALLWRVDFPGLRWPIRAYVAFFRNTPGLMQLFWIFYALPILISVNLTPFQAAVLALALLSGAYFAEVFRSGIEAVPHNQWEAGQALGMDLLTLLRRIILPQAVRRMIPPLTSQAIQVFKATPLAAIIVYPELLYQAMSLSHQLYRPLEIYTMVAGLYFVVLFGGSQLVRWFELRSSWLETNSNV